MTDREATLKALADQTAKQAAAGRVLSPIALKALGLTVQVVESRQMRRNSAISALRTIR